VIEIITPASTIDLTTLDAVKSEMQISGGADDDWLRQRIGDASDAIASYCRRVFGAETIRQTVRLDGRDGTLSPECLTLDRWPVSSITSVTEDGAVLLASEWELDGVLLYRLTDDTRISWYARKVVIVYVAGYALVTDLPRGIERACILAVANMYSARGTDRRIRSETVDGIGSTSWFDADKGGGLLPSEAIDLLRPHRFPSV
jgi:hypothetical protein